MDKKHRIEEMVGLTMDKLRDMVDANTVVGDPIHTPEGVTVIPVSKISMGLISGGSDFVSKKQQSPDQNNPYGGASSAGVNITPLGFLIISGENARMLRVEQPPGGPLDKALDLLPELMGKASNAIDQRKAARAEKKMERPVVLDETTAEEN